MKEYEIAIKISDEKYVDNLIIALVRQGYEVYYNDEEGKGLVCFKTYNEEVREIKR